MSKMANHHIDFHCQAEAVQIPPFETIKAVKMDKKELDHFEKVFQSLLQQRRDDIIFNQWER